LDYSLYKDVNGLSGTQPFDSIFKFAANDLIFVIVAIVALLFLIPWRSKRDERRFGAVAAVPSVALALIVGKIISDAVDRMRPFVAHHAHAHLLIHHSKDASFPSDHATAGFALAMAVWLYDRVAGALLLVLAAIMAFGRVYVGVHYPGDVIAGALIGISAALVMYLPPIRALVGRVAEWCARLYDRILSTASPRLAGAGADR
jgi:undecaprenyl-diphosphatase